MTRIHFRGFAGALMLILLAGWQAALLHPLKHVDVHGQLVHLADAESRDDQGSSEPADKLCDALAALTACAPETPAVAPVAASLVHERSCHAPGAPRAAQAPPFLAQAPPVLL